MNIYKQHINDYVKCPYLFAKNVLANKYGQNKLDGEYKKFKDHIVEVAAYEMQNNTKLTLSEYRTGYTNKFYSNKKDLFNKDLTGLVSRLNNIFSVFSDNVFLGYSVPIEMVIPGTTNIYKDYVSFLMIDPEDTKITAIEIENLSGDNFNLNKRMLKNWAHYYTLYTYLATKFDKKVEVVILDPVENQKIEFVFLKDAHEENIKSLSDVIIPIDKGVLYKNLFACNDCELIGECK